MNSQTQATRSAVLHASPNSNLRLKSIFLHPAIERPAAEAELARGKRDVEMVHPERALDHLPLQLIEIEAVPNHRHHWHLAAAARKGKVLNPVLTSIRHDHRPLRRVAQGANVAWPAMVEQRFEDHRRNDSARFVIFARIEAEIVVEQVRNILAPFAQRRQVDFDRVETKQEILPKTLFIGQLLG